MCVLCCDLLLCDCVWGGVYVGCVVVECGLFLEPRCTSIVSLCSGCVGCCAFSLICDA